MDEARFNEQRLSERFFNAIGNSRDQRIEDAEDIMDKAELLAKSLLDGAWDVVSNHSVGQAQEQIRDLFSDPDDEARQEFRRNVWQVMEEQIGTRVVSMQAAAENRLLTLILMGTRALVDDKTRDYLCGVSQCYLFGLDEQCVIMCRAALEAAFLQTVPDSLCEKHIGKLKEEWWKYTLDHRIKAIEKEDKPGFGPDLIRAAKEVKDAANDLLHPDRDRLRSLTRKRVDEIMFMSISVVGALARLITKV